MDVDKLKDIVEFPRLNLVYYFDNIKTKVDLEFNQLMNCNGFNKEILKQKWLWSIDIIEKCQAKCLNNKLPDELIAKINNIEFQDELCKNKIEKIKAKIFSYLLSNDSCLAILIESRNNKIAIIDEGFSPLEIQSFYIEPECSIFEKHDDLNFNSIKMNFILNEFPSLTSVVCIKSLSKISDLKLGFEGLIRANLKLASKYFAQFSHLKCLQIGCAQIDTNNDENIFQELKNLETLEIRASTINNFHFNSFIALSKLKKLTLIKCDIKDFNLTFLSKLFNLRYLRLVDNILHELKENTFSGLENIEALYLENFNFAYLNKDCFKGLKHLKHLELVDCGIKLLKKDCFYGLDFLETLDLNSNYNICFETACFNGLKNLKHLVLAKCKMRKLDSSIVGGLESLEKLDLESNYGIQLKDNCFKYLSSLKELSLSNCGIYYLKENTFIGLENLVKLDLSHSDIYFDSDCLNGLKNLKHLVLRNSNVCNSLTMYNDILKHIINLENVIVTFNIE